MRHVLPFLTACRHKMWRSHTSLADFPLRWSEPVLALQGDFFEASHTYRLAGAAGVNISH